LPEKKSFCHKEETINPNQQNKCIIFKSNAEKAKRIILPFIPTSFNWYLPQRFGIPVF
jgi:hypothetical protein